MYRIFVQILENKSLFQILGWTGFLYRGGLTGKFYPNQVLSRGVLLYNMTEIGTGSCGLCSCSPFEWPSNLLARSDEILRQIQCKKNGHIYRAEAAGISPCTLCLSQISLFCIIVFLTPKVQFYYFSTLIYNIILTVSHERTDLVLFCNRVNHHALLVWGAGHVISPAIFRKILTPLNCRWAGPTINFDPKITDPLSRRRTLKECRKPKR